MCLNLERSRGAKGGADQFVEKYTLALAEIFRNGINSFSFA